MATAYAFTSLAFFTSLQALVPSQQAPVFKSKVDLVHLDVSVLDKNRRPVRGLGNLDFTVFEDGKPQEIAIFESIDVPDPEPPPVAWMRDVTPDVTTNEQKVTRLWVIAVDDALIPTDPFTIKSTKQIINHIIDKFGPEDLVSVVFTADSRRAQDFTNDKTKLKAWVDKFSGGLAYWKNSVIGLAVPPGTPPPLVGQHEDGLRKQDEQFWLGAVNTLGNIIESLIAMPQTRKALIWVSPGIPMDPVVIAGGGGNGIQHRLKDLTVDMLEHAKRANVPVYPIDPSGLGGLEAFITGKVGNPVDPVHPPPWVNSEDYTLLTAANTGGHAIIKTNDFDPGINSIFQENGSYYLIGYNPTNTAVDGTLRKLEVKINRKDVDIRTRSGYYAPKAGDPAPKNTNARLASAVASPVPIAELPMRVAVAPFAIPGRGHLAAVTIALGVKQPVPGSAAGGRVTVSTDLQVTAFTTEGDNKGTQRSVATVALRAGAEGDADYEALSRIDLPPGRFRLRLAAYHEAAAKTGTVMVDVLVPDFDRDVASMSGVVIAATPGRPSAPRDLFKEILPVIPTAQRAFTAKDQAIALFDLYQNAGKGVVAATVVTRITDEHDAVLINETQTISVDRFAGAQSGQSVVGPTTIVGPSRAIPTPLAQSRMDPNATTIRAAEVQYKVPTDRLPAGRYLLTFEARMGAAVLRRDVMFDIRER